VSCPKKNSTSSITFTLFRFSQISYRLQLFSRYIITTGVFRARLIPSNDQYIGKAMVIFATFSLKPDGFAAHFYGSFSIDLLHGSFKRAKRWPWIKLHACCVHPAFSSQNATYTCECDW